MVISYEDFNYSWFSGLPVQKRKKGNQSTTQKYYYKDIITAFDIETTYIKEIDQSVMYIWQWQFGDQCTVVGRDWYSLRNFLEDLKEILQNDKLVIFVHNLSFEFQFLSGVFSFSPDDVFCMDHRKILKATYNDSFEFRCSYLQTNMSLRAFCEKMGVHSYKLKMDYKKERYWYTELTPKELAYCINDVKGLVEAIKIEMDRDNDNFYTLPLTSTGYARRDAKKAMRSVSPAFIKNQLPTYEIYKLLREAFRGGNTHASRYYSNQILEDLNSADISSSYPNEIVNSLFPVSKFTIIKDCTKEKLDQLIFKRGKAVLVRCSLFNLELKDDLIPVPYIPTSKCKGIVHGTFDNGRVLSAQIIAEITLTDIDYKILKDQYNFDIQIITVASARYGKLPKQLRDCVLEYYKSKTTLKDKQTDSEHTKDFYKLLYDKMKNLLNAQYGMMAQDPVKVDVKYHSELEELYKDEEMIPEQKLEEYNKRAFLVYQWGVWVTARAREHLQKGIDLCGINFVYCDTDSCKYIGNDVNWEILNKEVRENAEKNKTFAVDPNGKKHYMGLFEIEDHIKAFKTMGSKKYAYIDDADKLHITIAGVNKKIGAIELERAAKKKNTSPLEVMKEGFVFKYAGGLEARYSDHPEIKEYLTPDNVPIRITRNVSLVENHKTLGLTAEYKDLLERVSKRNIDL